MKLITDPNVATPFWGAIGGVIASFFRKHTTWWTAPLSIILAAVFAHWFSNPIIEVLLDMGLETDIRGGVSAVLGITSYELVRVLATGEFLVWIRLWLSKRGK